MKGRLLLGFLYKFVSYFLVQKYQSPVSTDQYHDKHSPSTSRSTFEGLFSSSVALFGLLVLSLSVSEFAKDLPVTPAVRGTTSRHDDNQFRSVV